MFWIDTRTPSERKSDDLREERKREAKKSEAVPWSDDIAFRPSLKIQGKTYSYPSLFNVSPCESRESDPNLAYEKDESKFAVSPNRTWAYRERILPAGSSLDTVCGKKRGVVCFDADIRIPMIHYGKFRNEKIHWKEDPWMSITPMEIFSLRPGIKLARGHVAVAGLGMGYQLERVCEKRSVTQVTLIEESQELVDWILPKINLHKKSINVIVGNAYDIVPEISCDVALIDIFWGYGGNRTEWNDAMRLAKYNRDRKGIKTKSGTIGKLWIWGA